MEFVASKMQAALPAGPAHTWAVPEGSAAMLKPPLNAVLSVSFQA
jgi:hypothetical protein